MIDSGKCKLHGRKACSLCLMAGVLVVQFMAKDVREVGQDMIQVLGTITATGSANNIVADNQTFTQDPILGAGPGIVQDADGTLRLNSEHVRDVLGLNDESELIRTANTMINAEEEPSDDS